MLNFNDKFWKSGPVTLNKPDLACLRVGSDLYQSLLFQPVAELTYDQKGLYYRFPKKALSKFDRFFQLAEKKQAELVITPEYSCPWPMLSQLIQENRLPKKDKLWVIGCQSISPPQLKAFIAEHQELIWIYDQEKVEEAQIHPNKFFDPACLCFQTTDKKHRIRNIVVVQFKTIHFGGTDFEWERDNLIKGDQFYILENERESTRLLTMICSDTLNEQLEVSDLNNFIHNPYLFIHIQLNKRPAHDGYKNYRNQIYKRAFQNKEVITLNWARNVLIDGHPWNKFGGSGIYFKSAKADLSDERVNHNHQKGLYYNHWEQKQSHVYMLNYEEHVFLIQNTKTSQLSDDPSQQKRSGPKMIELFGWSAGDWKPARKGDDGFSDLCKRISVDYTSFDQDTLPKDPLDMERIINLTSGQLTFRSDWSLPQRLSSLIIRDDEVVNRINFTHDPNAQAMSHRVSMIARFAELKTKILSKPGNIPDNFAGAELGYDPEVAKPLRYLLNFCVPKKIKGTAVFLGNEPPQKAWEFHRQFYTLFADNQQGKNLLIYYYYDQQLCRIPELTARPRITDNPSNPAQSIKGKRHLP